MSDHVETLTDRLDAISSELYAIKGNNVTIHGEDMYYIGKKSIRTLNNLMTGAIEMATPATATEIDKLRQQVSDAVSNRKKTEEAMKNWVAYGKELKTKLDAAHAAADDNAQSHNKTLLEMQEALHKSNQLLLEYKRDLEYAKSRTRLPETTFDPDIAVKARDNVERLTHELAESTLQRDAIQLDIKAHIAERETLLREHAQAVAKHNEMWTDYNQVKQQMKMLDKNAVLKPRLITEPSPLLKLFLGDNSMAWLAKLDAVNRANARERAFRLLMVTSHAENTHVKALKVIVQAAFDFIKKQGNKFLVAIEEWLTMLENDIKSRMVKPLKFYTEALQSVKDGLVKQQTATLKAIKNVQTKVEHKVSFYRKTVNKISSLVNKTTGKVKGFWKRLSFKIDNNSLFNKICFWRKKVPTFSAQEKEIEQELIHRYYADENGLINDSEQDFTLVQHHNKNNIVLFDAEAISE